MARQLLRRKWQTDRRTDGANGTEIIFFFAKKSLLIKVHFEGFNLDVILWVKNCSCPLNI